MKPTLVTLLSLPLFLLLPFLCAAQQSTDSTTSKHVYAYVEQMPQYEGGFDAMIQHVTSNITYSRSQKKGKLVISFVVAADGSINDVQVVKSLEPALDEACVKAVYATNGKWTAGTQNGKNVAVRFVLPINFSKR
ncbi:energy transducer TonB [Pontibacter sp. MBLB2868]|uniref:energy transducer TonB n=1 Tax=Pontibacter sp. MBLB2868 TaxID=3451555 RepID=UPI003F7545AE